ncbi:rod shape-determining protein MreC [Tenacibaculum holothuriorum]|uniref:Cell shape-determining protein MreC n=1 Tax=Tenacibaculum holothuriorum TaxID=1635173 RepID=A0A1Y2PBT2_9FLAO|nr:rod shape-determining protein MreC [Tenacibaculum holothuriorum]OSY87461.1 rod shape-determining protein MreC [Tenacibaculum holothuriorum]
MQQLIYFFQKYKYFLFFLFLEIIAVALIINNHSFHRSKFISSTNFITGGIQEKTSNISEYMNLKSQNKLLSEENTRLKNLLQQYNTIIDSVTLTQKNDSIFKQKFSFVNGKITSNNYTTPFNFLTVNRGSKNGLKKEMAVVNSKGIIGITDNVSGSYARVQSILNKNSKINARFKNGFHFGTLIWDGKNTNIVQLTDIPRQATYNVGDTIITGGKSTIFPEGILIGTVANVPDKITASNTIDIKLFNDMTNLGYVDIIISLDKEEIKTLQNKPNE